jgi:mitogen-activated protein kinase 1/3
VAAAFDQKGNRKVAIKQVANVFDDDVDALRVLREIKLLRHLRHPNIVKLYEIEEPISAESFRDLYLIMEHMDADLHKYEYVSGF